MWKRRKTRVTSPLPHLFLAAPHPSPKPLPSLSGHTPHSPFPQATRYREGAPGSWIPIVTLTLRLLYRRPGPACNRHREWLGPCHLPPSFPAASVVGDLSRHGEREEEAMHPAGHRQTWSLPGKGVTASPSHIH